MKPNSKAICPKALFIIDGEDIPDFDQLLVRMTNLLDSAGIDMYGSRTLQNHISQSNDYVINDPIDGDMYDILIIHLNHLSTLDALKHNGFVVPVTTADSIDSMRGILNVLFNIISILIRERSEGYDPYELIHLRNDILPGIDGKVVNHRLASSYSIQLRHTLRIMAQTMIDIHKRVQNNIHLLGRAMLAVDSTEYQDYLCHGQDEIYAPWVDYEGSETSEPLKEYGHIDDEVIVSLG